LEVFVYWGKKNYIISRQKEVRYENTETILYQAKFFSKNICPNFVFNVLILTTDISFSAPYPWEYDLTQNFISLPTNHSPAPYVVDWNNDGMEDLVVGLRGANQYGGIAVYLQQVDGSLAPPVSAFSSGSASTSIGWTVYFRPVVADWNGDTKKDLIYGQYYGSKGVVLCINSGTDAAPVFHGASCQQMLTSGTTLVGLTTGSSIAYVSPEVSDWDNDGDFDLLVGTGASANEKGIRLYENTGSSTIPVLAEPTMIVSKATTSGLLYENYYEPAIIDINDDDKKDLIIGGGQHSVFTDQFVLRICVNSGTDEAPTFGYCSYKFVPGLVNNVIDFYDWDNDGYLDLLRGFYSGYITNPVTYFHGLGPDDDGDGLSDSVDNCPEDYNPANLKLDGSNPVQIDTDGDGSGDICDPDDDNDTIGDGVDNCPWTPNTDQSDVDSDSRGDVCDPKDDRPDFPGLGSYEALQADKMEWGRKPVIILRADALSLSYRRGIAESLANEALSQGIPFSLAVIPWDTARYMGSPSADFLNSVSNDPNFEIVQHGTYHSCKYTGGSGEEYDCGMDPASSFNLMRVGHDSLENSVDMTLASHALKGFIPPGDAYDVAAAEAIMSHGYNYISSSWWADWPGSVYIDVNGLVHIPWTQAACGNGFATWFACEDGTTLEAHVGVDCADETICKPTLDGEDYSNWSLYAANSLKERCRYDIESRYDGICTILFELAVYDDGTGAGALDTEAFAGFQQVLSDLKDLAEETGAVFMTLGEYAAAQLIEDNTPPVIAISTPTNSIYEHHDSITIDFTVSDDLSGVYSVTATLDGVPVSDGDTIDLLTLSLGGHTFTVQAEDTAENDSQESVTFQIVGTIESLRGAVNAMVLAGDIFYLDVAESLLEILTEAEMVIDSGGKTKTVKNILRAFIRLVKAQAGKGVDDFAANLLITDARYVINNL
jgi:hypothetical protein